MLEQEEVSGALLELEQSIARLDESPTPKNAESLNFATRMAWNVFIPAYLEGLGVDAESGQRLLALLERARQRMADLEQGNQETERYAANIGLRAKTLEAVFKGEMGNFRQMLRGAIEAAKRER